MLLEVRFGVKLIGIPFHTFKEGGGIQTLADPDEVILMVGLEAKLATIGKSLVENGDKTILHQAILMVLFLWPRVGEEVVQAADAAFGNKILKEVTALNAQATRVAQAILGTIAANLANAAEQALNAKEATLRIMSCHLQQKPTIATAQINLKTVCWAIGSKNIRCAVRFKKVFWDEGWIHVAGMIAGFALKVKIPSRQC